MRPGRLRWTQAGSKTTRSGQSRATLVASHAIAAGTDRRPVRTVGLCGPLAKPRPDGRSHLFPNGRLVPERSSPVDRDQRAVPTRLELLHDPRVPVRVGEAEQRSAVARIEDLDLAAV